jgi:hypothetical protein
VGKARRKRDRRKTSGNCIVENLTVSLVVIKALEVGIFKRAQFREEAHTAHGNHRSKIFTG